MQEALDELRGQLGTASVDFAELVVLGAREKARALRTSSPAALAARERLAERVLRGDVLIDLDAANAVKRLGLLG